jgi:hypothetical protein
MTIEPEPGVVLVQLPESEHGNLPSVRKEHDSLTWGTVLAINEDDKDKAYLVGRNIHWRKYRDDARVGKNMALIEIGDILGTSFESTASKDQ